MLNGREWLGNVVELRLQYYREIFQNLFDSNKIFPSLGTYFLKEIQGNLQETFWRNQTLQKPITK